MVSNYVKTGRRRGESSPMHKLTVGDVIAIFLSKEKQEYVAALHGVTQRTVSRIKRAELWQHVTIPLMNNLRTNDDN